MTKKIILDCDPGHDDAVAMMLAYGNPEIELLGITTVGGNQTLEKVTRNALAIGTVIGMKNVPISKGVLKPLVKEPQVATAIHGETGLEGVDLPTPTLELTGQRAAEFIIDTVMSHEPKTITLVPTGSFTNIALAARLEPAIVDRVKEVVLMGGGYHTGNWSAVAEFNIMVDPEAAHIVFNESWPVTMVGLDLTHQALCTDEVVEHIKGIGTKPAQFVVDLMAFFKKAYQANQAFDFPPVHDPCAVAYVIDPSVMTTERVPVDVEIHGKLTEGMTVADFRQPRPADMHTQVAVKLDQEKFWNLIYDAIERIGEPNQ